MDNKTYNPMHFYIKYSVLVYWTLFWLFNSLDKVIGGSTFLWVGRDRFAQFLKFFASAGVESAAVTNTALIVAAGLEIFAFVFFAGALYSFWKKKGEQARTWFFYGIALTLIIFTLFAIGDHVFGDRFELLEHTLFWFLTLFTWTIYSRVNPDHEDISYKLEKKNMLLVSVLILMISATINWSIFSHSHTYFHERTDAVAAMKVDDNTYKFAFPFLGGSTAFEKSIEQFKEAYPNKEIAHIYTTPGELRLKKADGLIFYILTKDRR